MKELKNLQELDLTDTEQITDLGLKELKALENLRILDLWHTQVTDAGLKELKELTNLRELCLGATKVTDAGVKELKEPLKPLFIVLGNEDPGFDTMVKWEIPCTKLRAACEDRRSTRYSEGVSEPWRELPLRGAMHRPCRFSPGLAQRIRARAMAAVSFAAAAAVTPRLSQCRRESQIPAGGPREPAHLLRCRI
ncbi:MAG TPA: hypothetical protein VGY66_15450 [Gemmataceae bacterium]|nr:hypothetical protein [Gemmataceae bacterium]